MERVYKIALSLALLAVTVNASCPCVNFGDTWSTGANGDINCVAQAALPSGWQVTLEFDGPVDTIEPYQGSNGNCTGNTCTFTNQHWNTEIEEGQTMFFDFGLRFDQPTNVPAIVSANITDLANPDQGYDLCALEAPATTEAPTTTTTEPSSTKTPCEGNNCFNVTQDWHNGYTGNLFLTSDTDIDADEVEITFDQEFDQMFVWNGKNVHCANSDVCTFNMMEWNTKITAGETKVMGFQIIFDESQPLPKVASIKIDGVETCAASSTTA